MCRIESIPSDDNSTASDRQMHAESKTDVDTVCEAYPMIFE